MDTTKYPLADATAVANEIVAALSPGCDKIVIAGSVRRLKPEVGDVEIVYVPRLISARDPRDLFASLTVNLADEAVERMVKVGALSKRKNAHGHETYGTLNKLMTHVRTGIPVDLFATSVERFDNYLVCRTGPADLNVRIATLAKQRGYRWNPYGPGFTHSDTGKLHRVTSEKEVFDFVGLPYREPWERDALVSETRTTP